jgi:Ran GTPase-activating protein (RanGAP) involved in mRNA processing and transport
MLSCKSCIYTSNGPVRPPQPKSKFLGSALVSPAPPDAFPRFWTQVRELDISSTVVTTWGEHCEKLIFALQYFKNLRVFIASAALICDSGRTGCTAQNLAKVLQPVAHQLEELRLSNCNINDKRFKELFGVLKFPRLEVLWLRNNWSLSDDSAGLLIEVLGPNGNGVREISFRNCNLSQAGIDRLRRAFPSAKIDMGVQATAEALAVQNVLLKRFQ